MRRLMMTAGALLLAGTAAAAETVRQLDWRALAATGAFSEHVRVLPDGHPDGASLTVDHEGSARLRVVLAEVEDPGITRDRWAFEGEVHYRDVAGTGFLEMWSFFPDGDAFFSRTLADVGPMARIQGGSGWRRIVVPFFSGPEMADPIRLQLALVLPGPGTVELGPLRLVQYASSEDPLTAPIGWWNARTGGLIGGLVGGLLGLLGATLGVLVWLGRGRWLASAILGAFLVIGVASTVVGVAARLQQQPYGVWFPPLLLGVLATLLGSVMLPRLLRRYAELEDRRMRSLDVGP